VYKGNNAKARNKDKETDRLNPIPTKYPNVLRFTIFLPAPPLKYAFFANLLG
jgi:hypothetical protein